jgi:hypothetical protein
VPPMDKKSSPYPYPSGRVSDGYWVPIPELPSLDLTSSNAGFDKFLGPGKQKQHDKRLLVPGSSCEWPWLSSLGRWPAAAHILAYPPRHVLPVSPVSVPPISLGCVWLDVIRDETESFLMLEMNLSHLMYGTKSSLIS